MKKTPTPPTKKQLVEAKRKKNLVNAYFATEKKRVRALLQHTKGLVGEKKKLRDVVDPIAFVIREWGDIEVYENVTGNTFIVPESEEHKKIFGKEPTSKAGGKRVIYFSNNDLYSLNYGDKKVRCYLFRENDAMPIGADPRVWSERLEFTIDAVLINYEKLKAQMASTKNQWIVELVKWGGIVVLGYFALKWLFFRGDTTTIQTVAGGGGIIETAKNQTGAVIERVVG